MSCQSNYSIARGRSLTAILLIVLICTLFIPFLISAEGDGGDTPTPAPPPNGEGQTISDTTFMFLGGEDSTFYDME